MTTRRSFTEMCTHFLGGLMTAAIAGLSGAYLLTPAKGKRTTGWVDAADAAKLKPGEAEEVLFERTRIDGWRTTKERTSAWIVKKSEQEIIAFASGCTHLGCAFRYDAAQKNFICPCHVSAFSIEGQVLSGPAPRALDRYNLKVVNNRVLLGEIKKA